MAPRAATRELRRDLLRAAVEIIEEEHASDLRVADVAERLLASRRQLQRCFGDAGTSFRDVVRDVRMHRAAVLLQDRTMRVHDAARAVGYEQPAQFAKAFRQVFGVAPGEMRASGSAGPSRASQVVRAGRPAARDVPAPAAAPTRRRRRSLASQDNFLLEALER
jgi:AraC family transcriptional regulator, regulatory protein of adaptative response / methylphosphotriester-DNA alkyltransferase methyltransferase